MARDRIAGLEFNEYRLLPRLKRHTDCVPVPPDVRDALQGEPRVTVLRRDPAEVGGRRTGRHARHDPDRNGPRILDLDSGDLGQEASGREGPEFVGDLVGAPSAFRARKGAPRVESGPARYVHGVRTLPLEE